MSQSKDRSRRGRSTKGSARQWPEFAIQMQRVERALLVAAVPAAGVFFSRGVHDSFELPKLLLLTLLVATAATIRVARAVGTAEVTVPTHGTAVLAAAFLVSATIATLAADAPLLAAVGEYSRLGGLWAYGIYVLALLLFMSTAIVRDLQRLAQLMVVAGAVVGAYAVLQWAGADPFTWGGSFAGRVFSTLANPNFASGWLAVALPFAVWGVLRGSGGRGWRIMGAISFIFVAIAIYSTGSFQGILAGAVGLGVLWLAWLLTTRPPWFRLAIVGSAGLGLVAGVLVLVGLVWQAGPLAALGRESGVVLRKHYWATALSMFGENPIVGVGLDRFGGYFAEYRPLVLVQELSPYLMVDEPHSVPLGMFAEGGLLVGLTYVGFIALTGMALIRGFRVLEADQLLLLGAVGGGWIAYQVQSFVSIDLPALAIAHWILAAAIVTLAAPEAIAVLDLPWSSTKRRRAKQLGGRIAWSGVALAIIGLVALASVPWRADAALKQALTAQRAGQFDQATTWAARARDLGPWPKYVHESANIAWADDRIADAVPVLEKLVDLDPRRLAGLVTLARAHVQLDDLGRAIEVYKRVMEVDPLTPRFKAEFAQALIGADRPQEAVPLLRAVVEIEDSAAYWLLLGHAYEDVESTEQAVHAFEMAIAAAERDGHEELLIRAREQLEGATGG